MRCLTGCWTRIRGCALSDLTALAALSGCFAVVTGIRVWITYFRAEDDGQRQGAVATVVAPLQCDSA
jgi:hypothetical protein